DTNTLKDWFADSLLKFASGLLTVAGVLAVMLAVNWQIGLIALSTLPFLCYSLLHLYRKTKLSVKAQRRQEGQVASRMSEVLAVIPLVQAFARERHEESPVRRRNHQHPAGGDSHRAARGGGDALVRGDHGGRDGGGGAVGRVRGVTRQAHARGARAGRRLRDQHVSADQEPCQALDRFFKG